MSKTDAPMQNQQERPGMGRKIFIPLALVTAVGGFVTGMVGGPFVGFSGAPPTGQVIQVQAGTFPLAMPGLELQFVDANVSIFSEAAPVGSGPLHDAVGSLLTEASGFPLVLDGRTTLTELEEVIMTMAPVSAPWLVSVDLEPADGRSTAALSPNGVQEPDLKL